jgi:hypothetical protein
MSLLKIISRLALPLGLLTGCAAGDSAAKPSPASLSVVAPIPWAEIKSMLDSHQRNILERLTATGYVVMDGSIADDGRVQITRIRASSPDHVRDSLARAFGQKTVIHTVTSTSWIKPLAAVYVVFYHTTLEGDVALTFAERPGFSGTGNSGASRYLEIVQF